MSGSHHILAFLKFGSEKDIKDLFENGTIYMNPINKFRHIEDSALRGDNYEGVSRIWNFPAGDFEIPFLNYRGKYLHMHLKSSYGNVLGNIYSMYCISSKGFASIEDFAIEERVKEFGTHVLMIKDIPEFLGRVKFASKLAGLDIKHGFVEYYDKNEVNRAINVFEKPLEFEYQKEFRFFTHREELTPFILRIGSLQDIAELHTIEAVSGITMQHN